MDRNILISGTRSGLGKYLHEQFGSLTFTRATTDEEYKRLTHHNFKAVIHCAFNAAKEVTSSNLVEYIQDNVLLTQRMLSIPTKKFIYLSTIDVYPKDNQRHTETEVIDIDNTHNIYSITKLMSEGLVRSQADSPLILRCSAILGPHSRRNSLIKIAEEPGCKLSLSPNSIFNYVLASDVLNIIRLSIGTNLGGIFNLISSENISLDILARIFGDKVRFGEYIYNCGDIDNSSVLKVLPDLQRTSLETARLFLEHRCD